MSPSQPFVDNENDVSEPWQVPAFYGRSFAPQAYKRPTATPLAQTIAVEGVLTIGAAQSTRNPSGGTEATLGPQMHGPTPFDYNHPFIAQIGDNRLEQVFSRHNGNYPGKYESAGTSYRSFV
jgi:hypothetical protein